MSDTTRTRLLSATFGSADGEWAVEIKVVHPEGVAAEDVRFVTGTLLEMAERLVAERHDSGVVRVTMNTRHCKSCGARFMYGPGTGSTLRKVFCNDNCRVAWSRRKKAVAMAVAP